MKLTVRLSKPFLSIPDILKPDHRLTDHTKNWGQIPGSEAYSGTSFAGTPMWAEFVKSGVPDDPSILMLTNTGSAALIFVPIDNRYMIFCFGYGNHQLNSLRLEKDFGLKVVLNSINPTAIRSVDSKTHQTTVMNRRTQLSKENKITGFGFEINKDFLKQMTGKPSNSHFASSTAGSDGLILNCEVDARTLEEKVHEIYDFYLSTDYQAAFSWIDNIRDVRDKAVLESLNVHLIDGLNGALSGNYCDIQFACPEVVDNIIDHYKIKGYKSPTEMGSVDFSDLLNDMQLCGVTSVTNTNLDTYKVIALDGSGIEIASWPIRDWFVFEIELNSEIYLLSEGSWYKVSDNFYQRELNEFCQIISNDNEFREVESTIHTNEQAYLSNYSVIKGQEIIFDRDLSYVYGGGNQIEICDIYNKNKEFVHVKEGGASSKLSHLFNQGLVSARTFLNDVNFRNDMVQKMIGKPQLIKTIGRDIRTSKFTIVYRIIKPGNIFKLSFFSMLVLNETRKRIMEMGYQFRLEWVPKR